VLTEATRIDVSALPKAQAEIIRLLPYLKPVSAHEGVHGYIIDFEAKHKIGGVRLDKSTPQKLVKHPKLRRIEGDADGLSVGC